MGDLNCCGSLDRGPWCGHCPLNALTQQIHADNQHWWHDPATGARLQRNTGEVFMLMVSEIAEAMEGERKDLMDDKLPHRKMAEVELADTIIRILDFAGEQKMDLGAWMQKLIPIEMPIMSANKAEELLAIVKQLVLAESRIARRELHLCQAIHLIQRYCEHYIYNLWGAVKEKHVYNKTRADHKPEARLAEGGKKF